ncbi:MAG: hypothetical protein JWN95_3658 [Frankiales bacterium]|nr:hypothetical protein [Frankiales bacterium]
MTSPRDELQEQLNQITNEYDGIRQRAIERNETLAALSETFTDGKGTVSVTVGVAGNISELKFMSQRYREMAPAELADLIMTAISSAQERARKQLTDQLPTTMLGGINTADLLSGKADFSALLSSDFGSRFGRLTGDSALADVPLPRFGTTGDQPHG